MPDQELIYRLTRAVYERLGMAADEAIVENLVADVYHVVEPALIDETRGRTENGAEQTSDGRAGRTDEGSSSRLVVSVFGVDRPGIVAAVAQILAEAECSIVDINQTVVQSKFAMVLIADTSQSRETAAQLKDRFRGEGERLGVHIYAQREDLFNAMHRI